jgi:hypothetical protein
VLTLRHVSRLDDCRLLVLNIWFHLFSFYLMVHSLFLLFDQY